MLLALTPQHVRLEAAEPGERRPLTAVLPQLRRPGSTTGAMLDSSAALYGLASPTVFAAHHPLGRLIEPDEVAALVA